MSDDKDNNVTRLFDKSDVPDEQVTTLKIKLVNQQSNGDCDISIESYYSWELTVHILKQALDIARYEYELELLKNDK